MPVCRRHLPPGHIIVPKSRGTRREHLARQAREGIAETRRNGARDSPLITWLAKRRPRVVCGGSDISSLPLVESSLSRCARDLVVPTHLPFCYLQKHCAARG